MSQVLATIVANGGDGGIFIAVQPQAFTPEEADKLAEQIGEAAAKARGEKSADKKDGRGPLGLLRKS